MRGTMQNHTMPATFGSCANAASSCAKIAVIMDAIFVASIIICGLICGLIGLSILGIVLVLLAVLVLCGKVYTRAQRVPVPL